MQLLNDSDATLEPLAGKTVAVLGYGNQGRAQALNLRDSGVDVIVGNRSDEYRELAVKEGFEPVELPQAAEAGDILLVLTTDECMPELWDTQIAPGIAVGKTLCWGSGYNVGYGLIKPPRSANWIMIAPIMPGNVVRTRYVEGRGVIGQFAVENDATGDARDLTLALCKGIGLTRAGIFESSFQGEAELNLYTEQIVWAGLAAWLVFCYELAVEQGCSPEHVIMVLYASTESSEIMRLMAEHGFFKQMKYHSTTSQYGTLSRGATLLNDEIKERARRFFIDDIKGGAFVDEWSTNHRTASKRLQELWKQSLSHPISVNEDRVIQMIQRVQKSSSAAPATV
ncbi:MAG: ketol-acid reductoisomerase [Pirellulales bacterium]